MHALRSMLSPVVCDCLQPRLAIIPQTLALVAGDMFHLAIVIGVIIVMTGMVSGKACTKG